MSNAFKISRSKMPIANPFSNDSDPVEHSPAIPTPQRTETELTTTMTADLCDLDPDGAPVLVSAGRRFRVVA
jgi:hypothetical protein